MGPFLGGLGGRLGFRDSSGKRPTREGCRGAQRRDEARSGGYTDDRAVDWDHCCRLDFAGVWWWWKDNLQYSLKSRMTRKLPEWTQRIGIRPSTIWDDVSNVVASRRGCGALLRQRVRHEYEIYRISGISLHIRTQPILRSIHGLHSFRLGIASFNVKTH